MTARVFALPDLGEGLTDAELVRWLVAQGDTVVVDQPIAEVETAKSVVEVPSPFAGVVSALHGEEGEAILVGAPLLEVEEAAAEGSGPQVASPQVSSPQGSGQVLVGYGTTDVTGARRSRVATAPTSPTSPTAPTAPTSPTSPTAPTSPTSPTTAARADDTGSARVAHVVPVVSPVVRALARTHHVDLAALHPSGADGVVTRADVEAAFVTAAPSVPEALTPRVAPVEETADRPVDQRTGLALRATEPFSRFRRTVTETMARSRAEIPEATVWVDVDATDLWNGRRRLVHEGRTPSLLSFVARFALAALARRPELASRVSDDGAALETFDGVNLGIAADTPRGLVVPVVRRADLLSVRQLDAEIDRLARGAREGALPPAALTGSTFTINNYGSLGVDGSAAIINHPEVAILGVGRVIERPWVVDGAIVARRIAQLSLVFDHRVTDGGVAAGFLRDIADAIESPLGVLADAPPSGGAPRA